MLRPDNLRVRGQQGTKYKFPFLNPNHKYIRKYVASQERKTVKTKYFRREFLKSEI